MQHFKSAIFILLAISTVQNQNISIINNDYAFNMHRTLIDEDTNVLTSPLSYITQLGILQLVADGNTVHEIRRSIGYDSTVSSSQIHAFLSEIIGRLDNQTKNPFKTANVIVLRHDFPATETSKALLTYSYNASLQMYNIYKATETMETVNRVICQATDGVFEKFLISPLDSYNRLVMLNAVYFSGIWQYQFESVHTGYFYNKGKMDDISKLPMMSVHGRFPLAKLNSYGIELTAVELPYEDGDLKMLLLLPNATDLKAIIQIEQQLTANGLSKILNAMRETEVKVIVPSFKLQPGYDLMWSMQFLGVRDALNNAADFHRLSREKGLFVTKIQHRMMIEMDARGTKASPFLNKAEEVFVANRPFLFFIRDSKTEMVLFMGRIASLASTL